MKLTLSADQTSQFQTIASHVDTILQNLPGWIAALDALQKDAASAEAEQDKLQASGRHDKATVQGLQTVSIQRQMIADKIAAAQVDVSKQCKAAASILRAASSEVFKLTSEPLGQQLRNEVNGALIRSLTPFGADVKHALISDDDFEALPATDALRAFCTRGRIVGFDEYAATHGHRTPETLLSKATELKTAIADILEGRFAFHYTPPAKAA